MGKNYGKRIRLSPEEVEFIERMREGDIESLSNLLQTENIDPKELHSYWLKTKKFSVYVSKKKNFDPEQFMKSLLEHMEQHIPNYYPIDRPKVTDPHLLIFDPADIHIGKIAYAIETGDEYNCDIAVKRVLDGMHGLLRKSSGYPLDKIVLVVGNDALHFDTPKGTTTSGTVMDTEGLWHTIGVIAQQMYIEVIDTLRGYAPVDVIFNPSNHDFTSGWWLAQTLKAWYRNAKDVTVDADIKHRKYYRYGNSLMGLSHGDGAKLENLHALMSVESGQDWVDCKYKYWYLHHLHHKRQYRYQNGMDHIGLTIEYLRSPSAADRWHHTNGFVGMKAVEAFIHHPTEGEVARFTHYF